MRTDDACKLDHATLEAFRTRRVRKGESPEAAARMIGYRDGWRNAGAAVGAPKLFTFTHFPKRQWKSIRTSNAIVVRQAHHEGLHEEFKRRIKMQTVLPPELVEGGGNRRHVGLGSPGVGTNRDAKSRRLAEPRRKAL